jgi:hypothetical protein
LVNKNSSTNGNNQHADLIAKSGKQEAEIRKNRKENINQ